VDEKNIEGKLQGGYEELCISIIKKPFMASELLDCPEKLAWPSC